jgi:regulator of sigma E protease
MEVFLIRLLQFMLSISLLVLLHELGHFTAAKIFGVRVLKFYLFFDPWFHLFEFKPKNSETTYGIGWLPLGGYTEIAGMVDESFDTEQLHKPAQPWEFRSKPAWQRLIIMVAGVFINFILALFIYSMIMFYWGDTYIASKDMTYGFQFNKEAKSYGFKDHDILLSTDLGTFKDFNADLYRNLSKAKICYVLRQGHKVKIALPGEMNMLEMLKASPQFVRPYYPAKIDSVAKGVPAEKIGMKKGDEILAINGKKVETTFDVTDILKAKSQDVNKGMSHQDSVNILTVPIVFRHAGSTKSDTTQVLLTGNAKLGVIFASPAINKYKETHISYHFFASFPAGIKYGWDVLKGYVGDMKYVFTADGVKSLGGFGAIGSLFPPTWNWYMFWKMTAFLSIILAFMNILPIPALDGGHVLFLLYEMITHRKPSEKFLVRAEAIGIGILLLLLIVANLNDVLRWLGIM